MSKEVRCPMCLVGKLSWHDTNHNNKTDQGDDTPYFICSDQINCGMTVSIRKVDKLRELYRKVMA